MPAGKVSGSENAIAGAISGMYAVTMSYPFDLIKTRMHFETGATSVKQQLSMISTSKVIYNEGFKNPVFGLRPLGAGLAFYRGLDQLLPEAAFKVMLRFVAFKGVQDLYRKHILNDVNAQLGVFSNIICGSVAGAVEATLVVQPFERGKTLRADFNSPYDVFRSAYKRGGVSGTFKTIYTGYIPTLGRQVGNQATSFSVFYSLKNWYLKRTGNEDLNTIQRLGFGFIGGCGGACVTMPLDVAKTLAQKQQGDVTKGTIRIMADVIKVQGIRGLYAGLTPRLGRVGLDRAFGFLAFEWTLEQIALYKKRNQV